MGNQACCSSQLDLEESPPPPYLRNEQFATISDEADRLFRAGLSQHKPCLETGRGNSSEALSDHGTASELVQPPPARQANIDDFLHSSWSAEDAASQAPDLDEEGEAMMESTEAWRCDDTGLESLLSSILNRYHIFCLEEEWQVWQSRGSVAGKGSLVHSPAQAKEAAFLSATDSRLDSTLVIEIDAAASKFHMQGSRLLCRGPLPIDSVRVAVKLSDFIKICHHKTLNPKPARPDILASYHHPKNADEEKKQSRSRVQEALNQYSWLLDDFDESSIRRKMRSENQGLRTRTIQELGMEHSQQGHHHSQSRIPTYTFVARSRQEGLGG